MIFSNDSVSFTLFLSLSCYDSEVLSNKACKVLGGNCTRKQAHCVHIDSSLHVEQTINECHKGYTQTCFRVLRYSITIPAVPLRAHMHAIPQ